MLISAKLANKITNRLQEISNFIQCDNKELALKSLWDLAQFLNRYVETPEEERARTRREESSS